MTRSVVAAPLLAVIVAAPAVAQDPPGPLEDRLEALERRLKAQTFTLQELEKKIDDLLWFDRVGDVADIDKVYVPTVPVPRQEETYGITNERHPFRMWTYVFVPKGLDRARTHPLLMLPHGGVPGDFNTYYTHVVRELMERGYVVVAPEYRGSTGYGRDYWEAIDYGGLEVDDVVAARDWALSTLGFADPGFRGSGIEFLNRTLNQGQ